MQRIMVAVVIAAVVSAVGGWFAALQQARVVGHPDMHHDCRKDKTCVVDIHFDCFATNLAFTCTPYAVQEVILVNSGQNFDFTIDKTTQWGFNPSDGIKFTSANAVSSPSTGTLLPCLPDPQDKQQYHCQNKIKPGTDSDAYKYQIDVHGMPIVDPWIVNY